MKWGMLAGHSQLKTTSSLKTDFAICKQVILYAFAFSIFQIATFGIEIFVSLSVDKQKEKIGEKHLQIIYRRDKTNLVWH